VNDQLAVACMRSLYGTIEDLNIVAMNEYQKEFWTFRQSQQPEYLQMIEPLKPRVGDLTDPLYLDFISYSQFLVAARELKEAIRLEGDDSLTSRFEERIGEALLRRLEFSSTKLDTAGDQETASSSTLDPGNPDGNDVSSSRSDGSTSTSTGGRIDPTAALSAEDVLREVQSWLDFLVARGYCLKAKAVLSDAKVEGGGGQGESFGLDITTVGGATLWGTEAILNDAAVKQILPLGSSFDAYATKSLLRSLGLRSSVSLSTVDSQSTSQHWTVSKASSIDAL
jgi:hypothetical protein